MLETEIKKLTAAVEALNDKLSSGGDLIAAAAQSEKIAPAVEVKEAAQASPAAAAPSLDDVLAIKPEVVPPENVPDPATDTPAAVEAATKQQVIDATIELAKAKGRDAPVPIFTDFGIKKATECPEARYGELVAALTAALA